MIVVIIMVMINTVQANVSALRCGLSSEANKGVGPLIISVYVYVPNLP